MSEEPDIGRFEPRAIDRTGQLRQSDGSIVSARVADPAELLVWAVDTRHVPLFWFPRACPRGTFWARPETTAADVARFLDDDRSRRVHAIESGWLARMRVARIYAYRLPESTFRPHATVGGYWVSETPVDAIDRVELSDLLALHAVAGIELRILPALWPLWDRVIASSLEFSGIRLRNAAPRPGVTEGAD